MSNPATDGGHTYSVEVLCGYMNSLIPGRTTRLEYAPTERRGTRVSGDTGAMTHASQTTRRSACSQVCQ